KGKIRLCLHHLRRGRGGSARFFDAGGLSPATRSTFVRYEFLNREGCLVTFVGDQRGQAFAARNEWPVDGTHLVRWPHPCKKLPSTGTEPAILAPDLMKAHYVRLQPPRTFG